MLNSKHDPLLFRKINVITLEIRLLDSLYIILFLLGIIGNLLGLLIFSLSRRTWRISSIYVILATSSSITNLLCVIRYAAILHSTTRSMLGHLVGESWWACKFYEMSFSFRVMSSWVTLFWMFERLMCVSKRLKKCLQRCIPCQFKFLIPIIMLIIILACVIGPSVYMFQPNIPPNNETTHLRYCGLDPNASIQWQKYFHHVHFGFNHASIRCIFSDLVPAGAIILFNICILFYVFRICHRLHLTNHDEQRKEKSQRRSWMNIVLLVHSFLFVLSLLAHIIGHSIVVEAHETWWISLAVLTNCSLTFYVYCLSGRSFRNEIRRFIQRIKTSILIRLQIGRHRQQQSWQNRLLMHEMSDFHA